MNYNKFPNNGIIKKHRSKNDLINISKLKLNNINLTFLPTKKVNLLVDSMAKAVVLLAGFNPLIHYNIDLKAKIKDINFDLESSHNNLQKKSKDNFQTELSKYTGEMYMKLMTVLRHLPAGVNSKLYDDYYAKIQTTGSKKAMKVFLYYGYLWNAKR